MAFSAWDHDGDGWVAVFPQPTHPCRKDVASDKHLYKTWDADERDPRLLEDTEFKVCTGCGRVEMREMRNGFE